MYLVKMTESARSDLHQIASFIVADSGSYVTALEYVKKLEIGIISLETHPERGVTPKYKLLRLQGYRFLIIQNHLIFYKVNNHSKVVYVYRILHQKSAYQNFL